MRENYRELVAPYTRKNICVANLSQNNVCKMPQHRVARYMPVKIVHRLETIQVDIDKARRCPVALGKSDKTRHFAHESTPI